INAAQSLQVDTGFKVNIIGNLVANTGVVFNPGLLNVTGTPTFNFVGNSLGTLVNTNGDIVLSKNTILNASGKDLLIMASGNVISNGATTINLSSTSGRGGTLTVLAGMTFSPAKAVQTLDTLSTVFDFVGISGTGGSINLGSTSINTSST